ncbi:FABP family protein [Spongiibacter sp. KMU-158]|uniref:FABP family protein n=1 Tax=Spongiibacter pelagi TaxID=2760804 RepID=A0A927C0Q9_9GAMM|nr:heme-binding beta-barrel domain-containing protein [Spongiibacter pelagi]MBD2857531.1 FABP family protein [Spongiibacter pelagi]
MSSTIIDGVDYGPLFGLLGMWRGDRGIDKAPEPDGEDVSPFYETVFFEACGDVDNAETQVLAVVRYHQVVHRKSNDKVFHNESGYWSWDKDSDLIMQSFSIPRGVSVVAGGKAHIDDKGRTVIEVSAKKGDDEWGIVEAPFMRDNASSRSFQKKIILDGDSMIYNEATLLDIYGREYNHTDANRLQRDPQ